MLHLVPPSVARRVPAVQRLLDTRVSWCKPSVRGRSEVGAGELEEAITSPTDLHCIATSNASIL